MIINVYLRYLLAHRNCGYTRAMHRKRIINFSRLPTSNTDQQFRGPPSFFGKPGRLSHCVEKTLWKSRDLNFFFFSFETKYVFWVILEKYEFICAVYTWLKWKRIGLFNLIKKSFPIILQFLQFLQGNFKKKSHNLSSVSFLEKSYNKGMYGKLNQWWEKLPNYLSNASSALSHNMTSCCSFSTRNPSSAWPPYLKLHTGSWEKPVLLCSIPSGQKKSEATDHLISPTEAAPVRAALESGGWGGTDLDQWPLRADLLHVTLHHMVLAAAWQPLINLHK